MGRTALDDFIDDQARGRTQSSGPHFNGTPPPLEPPRRVVFRAHPVMAYTPGEISQRVKDRYYLVVEGRLVDPSAPQYDLYSRGDGPFTEPVREVLHKMLAFLLNNPSVTRATANHLLDVTVSRHEASFSWPGFDPNGPVTAQITDFRY